MDAAKSRLVGMLKLAGVGWDLQGFASPKRKRKGRTPQQKLRRRQKAQRERRLRTPFDRKTNYKLNEFMDWETDAGGGFGRIQRLTWHPESGEKKKNLDRKQLVSALKLYKKVSDKFLRHGATTRDKQQVRAFLNKGKYLLRDPQFSHARLEYE